MTAAEASSFRCSGRAVEAASPREVIDRPALSLIELGRDDEVYTWRVLSQYALRG